MKGDLTMDILKGVTFEKLVNFVHDSCIPWMKFWKVWDLRRKRNEL